jgi:hypothetical protein
MLPGAEVSRRLAAEGVGGVGAGGRDVGVDVPVHTDNAAVRLPILPDEFWDEREVHKKIREALMSASSPPIWCCTWFSRGSPRCAPTG